jgi:adenine-specific DNA methylase
MVFWWTRKPLASARVVVAAPLPEAAYQTTEQLLNYSENMYSEVRFLLVT